MFPDAVVMNQYYPAAFIPHSLNVRLRLCCFFCPPPSNVFLNMLAVISEACHFPHAYNLRFTTDTCFKALRSKSTRILFSCFSSRNKFEVRPSVRPSPLLCRHMWKRQSEPAAMWKFPFECFMSGGFPFTIELTTNKAATADRRPAGESRAKERMITIQCGMHIFLPVIPVIYFGHVNGSHVLSGTSGRQLLAILCGF